MTITAAIKNGRADGRERAVQNQSRSVRFLGSGLITDLSHIKAGWRDRSALTYGFSAHTAHEVYIGRPPHREGFFFIFIERTAVLVSKHTCGKHFIYQQAAGPDKKLLEKKKQKTIPPLWKSSHKPIPSIYYRLAKCICGCKSV